MFLNVQLSSNFTVRFENSAGVVSLRKTISESNLYVTFCSSQPFTSGNGLNF